MRKVLKHERVIRLGSLFESIDESRFLNSALLDIEQKKELDREVFYPVNLALYAEQGSISLGKAYTEILNLVTKARETTIKVPLEDGSTWYTSLIYDFIAEETEKRIAVRWNKNLIPYISGMMESGKFCYYDPRLSAMSNVKAYKLAELIQKNLWRLRLEGRIRIPVSEIRFYTNTEDSYHEFKELNRHVIKPCIEAFAKYLQIKINCYKARSSEKVEFVLNKKDTLKLTKDTI